MRRNAFTLAETMLTLIIIAVLVASAIPIFKSFDKNIQYMYSNIYHVLDRAWYNTSNYWISSNTAERSPFLKNQQTGAFAEEVTDTVGALRLCSALIEYINPLDRVTSCQGEGHVVSALGSENELTSDNVLFTATNGVRFWISRRYPNDPNTINFYIVFADLNGTKLPNSMTYAIGAGRNVRETRDPDIFAFAVLETGRVCPLGVPEVETRYMSARILYQGDDSESILTQDSIPYIVAKAKAWGYYTQDSDDSYIMEETPLSFNDRIKQIIDERVPGSNIYSFLNGQTMKAFYKANFNNSESEFQLDEELNCTGKNTDSCDVVVDKYTY